MTAVPDHPCTAWCRDGAHVDVVHAAAGWSDAEVGDLYCTLYGVLRHESTSTTTGSLTVHVSCGNAQYDHAVSDDRR
jgi:hypothetical protein